jgi:hypothetical protein
MQIQQGITDHAAVVLPGEGAGSGDGDAREQGADDAGKGLPPGTGMVFPGGYRVDPLMGAVVGRVRRGDAAHALVDCGVRVLMGSYAIPVVFELVDPLQGTEAV